MLQLQRQSGFGDNKRSKSGPYSTSMPVMTSNTAPAGYVASTNDTTYGQPYIAFNASGADEYWGGIPGAEFNSGLYLQIQFPSLRKVTSYNITARLAAGSQTMNGWVFQGSDDGITWFTLDTRPSSQPAWGDGETRGYSIAVPEAYLYYRWFNITNTLNLGIALIKQASFSFATN